jgi:acetyl-CoA carboxylase carboxyl transferase subunit alpha
MAKQQKEQPDNAKPVGERTAFERVQLARHSVLPYTLDLIERLFEDLVELHGD